VTDQSLLFEDVNPGERSVDDFYRTPAWMTQALLARCSFNMCEGVVEPCAGDGAIVNQLPQNVDALTNDIVARHPFLPEFLLDARAVKSWHAFKEATSRIDVVVTNPPFNEAYEIVVQAVDHARVAVAMLLRLSWLEPTEERGPWLLANPPEALIVLPRHDFRGNGATDSVTSAWMVWMTRARNQFCDPGIQIVTKAERDRLIAKYGDR